MKCNCDDYCMKKDPYSKHSGECRQESSRSSGCSTAPALRSVSLKDLAAKQYDWVERMGWHNKTVLEALALIGSEVGEAVNECRGEEPTESLGEELADIILRTIDLAQWQGIDIEAQVLAKMEKNEKNGTRGRRI